MGSENNEGVEINRNMIIAIIAAVVILIGAGLFVKFWVVNPIVNAVPTPQKLLAYVNAEMEKEKKEAGKSEFVKTLDAVSERVGGVAGDSAAIKFDNHTYSIGANLMRGGAKEARELVTQLTDKSPYGEAGELNRWYLEYQNKNGDQTIIVSDENGRIDPTIVQDSDGNPILDKDGNPLDLSKAHRSATVQGLDAIMSRYGLSPRSVGIQVPKVAVRKATKVADEAAGTEEAGGTAKKAAPKSKPKGSGGLIQ